MIRTATACIFDMDGLLLDTESIYTQITQSIVGQYGKTYDWSLKGNMIGRPMLDSARYLVRMLELPITPEEYLKERSGLARTEFPKCHPMPGARELVSHLSRHNIPIAVATSSHRNLYEIKTTRHQNWFALFDAVVTGDDPEISRGKPAPDIFLIAAKRLGVDPVSALVFEDAPSGLEAGIAAGAQVIAIPDSNMDKSRYTGATQILASLEQFNPERFGLPAIRN